MPHLQLGRVMLQHLAAALAREKAAQRAEHQHALAQPLSGRVAVGVAWAPLQLEAVERAGRRLRLVLRGTALHEGIGAGDTVRVGPVGRPDDGIDGLCVGSDYGAAEVLVPDMPPEGPLCVTLRFDATTFDRYSAALKLAADTPSRLRDVLVGKRAPGQPQLHGLEHPALAGLDASQQAAARSAIASAELALIHGPPGTGKTTVLTALLRVFVSEGDRPWALADSNAATDHLARSADAAGLSVVRLGPPARIHSDIEHLSLEHRARTGPYGTALDALDRDIARAERAELRDLLRQRDALWQQAKSHVLGSADVVASTLGTLARMAPELARPRTAVVDEATQALEPAIWVAVPWVERLVLVGDPHQLGPVVIDVGNPLERSMLSRLVEDSDVPFPRLDVQYRMHHHIQDLVEPVYGPTYRPGPGIGDALLNQLPGVEPTPLTGQCVTWVDTAGAGFDEERDEATMSLRNPGEAEVIARAVRQLRAAGVPAASIGVIAPYSAQVALLKSLVDVEVATVNAFQGREKEAILCSWVRSNPDGELGFVADRRRLTVALTRARRFLLCVGDSATLAGHPAFADVLDRVHALGRWQTVWEEPWSTE